jgi:L-alanine-DL-glutamate epimerase-like enolase superfamily enzyme
MGRLQSETQIPIVADESVQTPENIEDLAAAGVQGVNIKLMKVGGISPALKMIRRSKHLGLKVMLGCMIETAVGTTAMAHLGSCADWLDLDASALITNDPFKGMILDDTCTVRVPDRAGIGVRIKPKEVAA